MWIFSGKRARAAFTLIELLIVVAIIAILAAIAVPNFLEAQVRAKVSRVAADTRSIRVGLEAYRVDHNKYPETDTGEANLLNFGVGLFRITTPVAFLSSVPISPFKEENIGHPPATLKNCNRLKTYLYVRGKNATPDPVTIDAFGYDANFVTDRQVYLGPATSIAENNAIGHSGEWELKSVGPNNMDDRDSQQVSWSANARIYDPTNGSTSHGDVIIYDDRPGLAKK